MFSPPAVMISSKAQTGKTDLETDQSHRHTLKSLRKVEGQIEEEGKETFNPSSDEEEPVLVLFAQVTRAQPAVRVQSLLGLLGHVEVTHEHMAAPEADFTHSILVRVVHLRLTPGKVHAAALGDKTQFKVTRLWPSCGVLSGSGKEPGELEGLRLGDGVRAAALTHAVQLIKRNVQTEEELQGVFGDRSGARVALAAAVQPQGLPHFFKHQLFGDLIAESCVACRFASEETRSVQGRIHTQQKH